MRVYASIDLAEVLYSRWYFFDRCDGDVWNLSLVTGVVRLVKI